MTASAVWPHLQGSLSSAVKPIGGVLSDSESGNKSNILKILFDAVHLQWQQ
jgi:hypothetical protein